MKTVMCNECEQEVSKRQTLSVKGKRYCRHHKVVTDHLESIEADKAEALRVAEEEAENKRQSEQIAKNMEKIMRPSMVNTLRDLRAIDPGKYQFAMMNMRRNKGYEYTTELKAEIEAEEVSAEDAAASFINAVAIGEKMGFFKEDMKS